MIFKAPYIDILHFLNLYRNGGHRLQKAENRKGKKKTDMKMHKISTIFFFCFTEKENGEKRDWMAIRNMRINH